MPVFRNRRPAPAPAGFTMIELLVVIVIIGLLITLVTAVGSKVIRQQKVRNTEQIMQNTMMALDQFATENPLGAVYNRKGKETFGKYPPYQMENYNQNGSIAYILEEEHSLTNGRPASLKERLARDLSGSSGSISQDDWVQFGINDNADSNDDNRALSAYLAAYTPDAWKLIPSESRQPIDPRQRDYINPRGTGGLPRDANNDWVDVLGVHDAWGVPLDYLMYVKVEWKLYINSDGDTVEGFRITDRKPVLRSRGIDREVYDVDQVEDRFRRDASSVDKWIFSEPFCSPVAKMQVGNNENNHCMFLENSAIGNGWARLVAARDVNKDNNEYGYIPEQDVEE